MTARLPRLLSLVLAALLIAGVAPLVAPLDAHASDAAAYKGRLIVIWKDAPDDAVAGVTTLSVSRKGHRSVVTTKRGDTAATAARLRRDPRVKAVLPDVEVRALDWPQTAPNDTHYAQYQADLGLIGVPTAWQTTIGSPDVVVAVLDTGMTIGHADFAGLQVVSPRNEITNTTDVTDVHGHGTHVIGTIAAQTNNGIGVASVAPGVAIMPVKVLGDTGSGAWSDMLDGMDWARTHGADVISMSLGASLDPSYAAYTQPSIDDEYAAGITIVAAAGNNGTSSLSYPASYNHVISVAATDNAGAKASFSQYNASVDIAAPGVSTLSTSRDGSYVFMSGTSMATPHVAGVAALVRSAYPTWTVDQVEAAMTQTATDMGVAGRDDAYGSGLVNVAAAIGWNGSVPAPAPPPSPKVTILAASPTSISYDSNSYCPTAVKATTVKATLANVTSGVAAPSKVELFYTRPDGTTATVAMTRGTAGTTTTPWTAAISTATDRALRGGSLPYWVVATGAAGGTYRFPAGTATNFLTVKSCANTAPVVSAATTSAAVAWTNPLGTGTVPAGMPTTLVFTVAATDTDGIAGVDVVLSGAGLAAPVTVPLVKGATTWAGTISPTTMGMLGGSLAWKAVAKDALGLATTKAGTAIAITRADTAGSSSIAGLSSASNTSQIVTITADDPDATFAATTSLGVKLTWTATYTNASTGVVTTTPAATATATFLAGHSFKATLATTWLSTGTKNVSFRLTPVTTDPFKYVTTGTPSTVTVSATGAPTIASAVTNLAKAATDPLGTGNHAGIADSLTFTAKVADTDAVSAVVITYGGPGLAGTRSLALAKGQDGVTWTGTLNVSTSGITGTGNLAWSVGATDALGLTTTKAGTAVTVTRADTAGSSSIAGVSGTNASQTVLVTATDPDATVASSSNLTAKVTWTATYLNQATGATTTTSPATVTAAWVSGSTYRATIATPWLTTGVKNVSITLTPSTTDPYKYVTAGTPSTVSLGAVGAPTLGTVSSSVTTAATDPLGTGTHAITDKVTFTARAYDTDKVSSVAVIFTGPGLASAGTLALAVGGDGVTWTGTLDVSASGVTGTGALSWKVVATDAQGLATTSAAKSVAITRADTEGSISVSGVGHDTAGNVVVTLTAADPDATFGSTSNLIVKLAWSARIGATTTATKTVAATWVSGHTWTTTLAVATALNAARTGDFTFKPTATDPYKYLTTGAQTTQAIASRN